jgi:hypothetical protein
VRGHAEQGTDGDHAGAAHAGEEDVPRSALKSILAFGFFLRSGASTTETKLGQKPRTQLKSLLQPLWSISRLRPNSVSFGSTETQADFTEQSPQPSQTSELMTTRFGGSTISLRLRRRRFSAAQVWS